MDGITIAIAVIISGVLFMLYQMRIQSDMIGDLNEASNILSSKLNVQSLIEATMDEWVWRQDDRNAAIEFIATLNYEAFEEDVIKVAWQRDDGKLKERIVKSTIDLLEAEYPWH